MNRSGRKVLLVDDSADLRELYEIALADKGHEVRSASSAEQALEILGVWKPDLVITDLFMPGIGGLELITRLRSDFAPPIPPIVAISGVVEAKGDALRRGASRFETKPIGYEEIQKLVEDAFVPEPSPLRPAHIVKERRAAARAIGEATLAKYLTEDREAFARADVLAHAMARFFGHSSVLTFLLRGGKLELIASSNPAYQVGVDASEVVPLINDVVESHASIVVTNGASWLAQRTGSPAVRFLAAVPYLLDRTVVGAICLVDEQPHDFSSAALGLLEYLAQRASGVVRGGARVMGRSGLFDRNAIGAVLEALVRSAREADLAFGFGMFQVAELPSDGSLAELLRSLPGPQLMVGSVDSNHLAAVSAAESVEQLRERLMTVRRQIESRLVLERSCEQTYEFPIPQLQLDALVARGRELLARALSEGRPFLAIDARRRRN